MVLHQIEEFCKERCLNMKQTTNKQKTLLATLLKRCLEGYKVTVLCCFERGQGAEQEIGNRRWPVFDTGVQYC